jgi:alginate O-acetyltransferase complex protein AlgI
MVFSSVEFLFVFFPAFLLAQSLLPNRNITYLLFSVAFYFFGEGWYTGVLILSTIMNFGFGFWIDQPSTPRARKIAISASVAANLALLFVFKYANFFCTAVLGGSQATWLASIHLPLGISFFTFHAISYLVDVYRGNVRAERSFINVALYITMFPQLIAGPIIRFHTIADQLRRRMVTGQNVYYGFTLFCFGMGQKVLLADPLAGICDPLFTRWETLTISSAWLAALAYTFQIFLDFAGYSNMAIGLGWMTGFYFPQNFNYPYVSRSITEFWRRWHMSLSRWFRDYLYIPLGGNRHGPLRTYRNLICVFLLCGLWHGAGWTFLIWGAYYGVLLVIERLGFGALLQRLPVLLQHLYAMLAVIFGWVLFRADDITQARVIIRKMILPIRPGELAIDHYFTGEQVAVLVLAAIFSTPVVARVLMNFMALPGVPPWRRDLPTRAYRFGATAAVVVLGGSAIKILTGSYSPFIYFRF